MAGGAEAAERHADMDRAVAVDPKGAGAHGVGDAVSAAQAGRRATASAATAAASDAP